MKVFFYFFSLLTIPFYTYDIQKTETIILTNTTTPYFTEIVQGNHSNFLKKQQLIISNQKDLILLYDRINASNSVSYKIPNIDFTKEQVIGLFMGPQTIEGHKIVINDVKDNGNEILINYLEMAPTSTTKNVDEMIISHPFYIAKIKKTTKPIKFINSNC